MLTLEFDNDPFNRSCGLQRWMIAIAVEEFSGSMIGHPGPADDESLCSHLCDPPDALGHGWRSEFAEAIASQ